MPRRQSQPALCRPSVILTLGVLFMPVVWFGNTYLSEPGSSSSPTTAPPHGPHRRAGRKNAKTRRERIVEFVENSWYGDCDGSAEKFVSIPVGTMDGQVKALRARVMISVVSGDRKLVAVVV